MYRQKYVMFILVALLTFFCLVMAVELVQKKPTIEIIKAVETVETAGLTLLERMYIDLDNDTKDESIELYTSARRGKDGLMEWDDGQLWLLLVTDGGKGFPI